MTGIPQKDAADARISWPDKPGDQFYQHRNITAPGGQDVVIHSHKQPTIRPFDPEQVQVTSLIDEVFTEIETLQPDGQQPGSLPGLDRLLAY